MLFPRQTRHVLLVGEGKDFGAVLFQVLGACGDPQIADGSVRFSRDKITNRGGFCKRLRYKPAQPSAETASAKCVAGGNRSCRFAGGNRGEVS